QTMNWKRPRIPKGKFSETQIVEILREIKEGQPVRDVCHEHTITEATYYDWQAKYEGMEASDIKQMRELEVKAGTKEKKFTDRTILSRTGRLWLMVIVFASLVSAIFCLFWIGRDGAIRSELKTEAIIKLLGFYVPLLSLMGAFYFGEKRRKRNATTAPLESFIFALIGTAWWVLFPIFLLWFGGAIQEILALLERIKPVGDTVALAAIGYYFSKN
ncbi:MAG TPA: transposase, partial [Pyrinomonadaceae bacterium]|nr:transposase [Pyrinomonadaceae bacterium]